MKNLKVVNQDELKDWAENLFKKNSFNMVDVSSKKETFRRALASGKIYVGEKVFNMIKNNKMPKGLISPQATTRKLTRVNLLNGVFAITRLG